MRLCIKKPFFQVECLALSPDGTLLATGGVDKQVTLSTIDLSDEFNKDLHQDTINDLPYAKLPAKTTSSLQEMKGESHFLTFKMFYCPIEVKEVFERNQIYRGEYVLTRNTIEIISIIDLRGSF